MKVINRGTVKIAGCPLRLEDWSMDYPCSHHGADVVAAYPTSRESLYTGTGFTPFPKRGESFRLEMHFETENAAVEAFGKLLTGLASLHDYASCVLSTPTISAADFMRCI